MHRCQRTIRWLHYWLARMGVIYYCRVLVACFMRVVFKIEVLLFSSDPRTKQ